MKQCKQKKKECLWMKKNIMTVAGATGAAACIAKDHVPVLENQYWLRSCREVPTKKGCKKLKIYCNWSAQDHVVSDII